MVLIKWVGPKCSGPLWIQMRVAGNGATQENLVLCPISDAAEKSKRICEIIKGHLQDLVILRKRIKPRSNKM